MWLHKKIFARIGINKHQRYCCGESNGNETTQIVIKVVHLRSAFVCATTECVTTDRPSSVFLVPSLKTSIDAHVFVCLCLCVFTLFVSLVRSFVRSVRLSLFVWISFRMSFFVVIFLQMDSVACSVTIRSPPKTLVCILDFVGIEIKYTERMLYARFIYSNQRVQFRLFREMHCFYCHLALRCCFLLKLH